MDKEGNKKSNILKEKPWIASILSSTLIFGLLGVFLFWQIKAGTVFIENSQLEAPIVNLSPVTAGTLNALYVEAGDRVNANTQIALVGANTITTKEGGVIMHTPDALGGYFTPGMTVVSLVKTEAMKVVGSIEENKGLKDVAVGQRATFTVDAFPGKKYSGIVDEISATSEETGVLFSISDKRPIKKFTVTVRFNIAEYPELKSGMSAKITVHTRSN